MNKPILVIISSILLLASCGDNGEKKAGAKLLSAREALESKNYSEAKKQIDSIKILYPEAFKARKEGLRVMRQVELEEQQQGLAYMEQMLTEKQAAFEAIKDRFVFEKDTEYQEVGNYFWPTQTVEKNLNRSYLRFQVNELGAMVMTSIYCGAGNIHHTSVKVTAPDGSFAETPVSNDCYATSDLGVKTEKADHPLGQDGNVLGFIYLNRDKNIRVEYIGDRKYNTVMSVTDRTAAAEVYELSQVLTSIQQIKSGIKEAGMKIEFVKRNMEKHDSTD